MASNMLSTLMVFCLLIHPLIACLKAHFEMVQFKHHPGTTMETLAGATMADCRRACRMTKDCYHFNMLWPITGGAKGECVILSHHDISHIQMLVDDNKATYYWLCPGEMIFAYGTKKCYQVITKQLPQSNATTYCSQVYQGAHLVDFESDEEQTVVNGLVEATLPLVKRYYTSGMNVSPSLTAKDPADFKWLSTDKVINYTNWNLGQPDRRFSREICIIARRSSGWQWYDSDCDNAKMFVCELF